MAEKLTESTWTAYTRKQKLELDDGALVKALIKLDKTDATQPERRLDALRDVIEQAQKQIAALAKRKKELGDKVFSEAKEKLDALARLADEQSKDARSALADAGEDEDSPALLTSKMVPLLRELRKSDIRMHALICLASKSTVVLIMRKPIASSRRKLLIDAANEKGAAKYVVAECLMENNALTFVVQSQASGLAKKLRQALLDQTEMRLKVKVRGEDGAVDEDGEEHDSDGQAGAQTEAAKPTSPSTAEHEAYAQKVHKLQGRLAQALRDQHPESTKLRALISLAGERANDKKDFAGAIRVLETLEHLLDTPPASSTDRDPGVKPASTIAPAIVYTQTRLAWQATRKKIQAELNKLEQAILSTYQGHAALRAVTQGVRRLDTVLELFDESLSDALDAALNETDGPTKQGLHDQARAIIVKYTDFLKSEPIVQELDANPFVPISVQSTLSNTLAVLAAKIP